jgi:hypothetical protein
MTGLGNPRQATRRRSRTGCAAAVLAVVALAGCAEGATDEAAADSAGDIEASAETDAASAEADTPEPTEAAADATLVFGGEELVVHEVHCLEDGPMEHDSPSSVLANFVHPADGEEYQFGVRGHGTRASIRVAAEFNDQDEHEHVPDHDEWETYVDPDEWDASGEEIVQLDGIEYGHEGAVGALELEFDDYDIRLVDADYAGPDPRSVEFDITCP